MGDLNGVVQGKGVSKGMAKLDTAINAAEMILMLAPETNGEVAVKAWEELEKPRAGNLQPCRGGGCLHRQQVR